MSTLEMLALKLDRPKSSSHDGASLSPGNRIFEPPYSMTVTTLWLLRLVWGQVVGMNVAILAPPLTFWSFGSSPGPSGSLYVESNRRYSSILCMALELMSLLLASMSALVSCLGRKKVRGFK